MTAIYLDSTDSQIRDHVHELLRIAKLPHLCNSKGIPNKPFTTALRERIPYNPPLTFKPEATVHFDKKGWPVTRNYTMDKSEVYIYS